MSTVCCPDGRAKCEIRFSSLFRCNFAFALNELWMRNYPELNKQTTPPCSLLKGRQSQGVIF